VHDCWDLLNNQKEYFLPRGEREPDSAYKRRIDAALPSGFFRDALRTFAGMLTASHWRELPPSLQAVVSDVDGKQSKKLVVNARLVGLAPAVIA